MGSDQDPKIETESGKGKTKKKKHECSICGLEFSSGQALGGHMRRHRMTNAGCSSPVPAAAAVAGASKIPGLMRSNSKSVMFLDMDLNLTPLENDLKLLFGNWEYGMAPNADTSIS
ncbi:putative transcription factor C2H2 family [Rosa chinensis]|uniref:Putative transcription factor C2H2 family n=1 Tax=Rosa chinensis TaxID=74649 RepID=A0A2P6RA99_ROSCH|nr:zinc finger protein ZAT11 [Rosa chinensis]PRQ43346.1 putative transcription factor C2H2 family [Rosa chinensis]